MSQKSITDYNLVKELLETIGGEEAVKLIKICEKKRKAFTDEDISKKMSKKVTEIRTTLNKLHFRGIATYQKTRNSKTGWYNYTWEINKSRIADIIIEEQKEYLDRLSEKKSLEENYNLFDCKGCNERMPFEIATEYNFICPNCGGIMDSTNNPERKKELDKKIKQIEKELEALDGLRK